MSAAGCTTRWVGWRALFTVGDEDAKDVAEEVAVYCPECAAREFGGQ